jgi:hypothetical protein
MIEPKGTHPNRTAGLLQVIDDKACSTIVNCFNQDAAAGKLSHGREMLIDHEHFRHDPDKETRAYGWLTRLHNRDDGIYGQVRWSGTGQQAVDAGDYRFFSTEYDPKDLEVLNDATPRSVRPLRLDGLTLTNDPNNKGGRPITNRTGTDNPALDVSKQFADRIPTAALEAFFNAVGAIRKVGTRGTGVQIAFKHAWNLTKQQHPDLYKAAFGDDEASSADTAAAAKAAADDVGAVANRVRAMTNTDFKSGWNFVKDNLPHIFNRQFSSSRVNRLREVEEVNVAGVQKRAAQLFEQLVRQEETASQVSYSLAFIRIKNRETVLCDLANYQITPEDAFGRDPELRKKLMPLSHSVANRQNERINPAEILAKASQLFGRLVHQEQTAARIDYRSAFQRVMNREKNLCDLVNTKITPAQALARDPELRNRLE